MDETLDILIIEDDPSINEVVAAHLARTGHRCVQAFSGSEGLLRFRQGTAGVANDGCAAIAGAATREAASPAAAPGAEPHRPFDLVITDLMLPGATGEQVVEAIRAEAPDVPLIVISARITAADKVALLKLGADDYLTKPFDLDELSARIDVQFRHRLAKTRASGGGNSGADAGTGAIAAFSDHHAQGAPGSPTAAPTLPPLRYKKWALDEEAHSFSVAGTPLALTRTEFGILALLMTRPSKVFTKQELFELVWGEPYSVDDSTVNVHVSNLRRKLKPTGTEGYLQTVWGLGYKLS